MSDYLAGDLSKTNGRLAQATSQDLRTLMLAANCYRQLGQQKLFSEKMEQARRIDDSKDQVELALAMQRIQLAQVDVSLFESLRVLRNAGAVDSDARSVVVQCAFASNKLSEAQLLLDQWRQEQPDSAQLEYLTAVYANITGNSADAESKFIQTIVHHPRHELSWLALADLYVRPPDVRFEQAEALLTRFVKLFADNAEGPLRLARVQRRLGRNDPMTTKLLSSNSRAEVLEMAKIASDAGDYSLAVKGLATANLATSIDFDKLTVSAFQANRKGNAVSAGQLTQLVSWGATAIALSGDPSTATAIFSGARDRIARLGRIQDLSVRRSFFPSNQELVDEWNAVDSPSFTTNFPRLEKIASPSIPEPPAGLTLYIRLCGACHGSRGDGAGPAACNLYPAPRNFLYEPIRMVSATNRLATDFDLKRAILQGQPGTSMPAFNELSESELNSLVAILRWFRVVGLNQQYANHSDISVGGTNPTQLPWVEARSQPSAPLTIPQMEIKSDSAASGQVLFRAAKCTNCHSTDNGVANDEMDDAITNLFDSQGRRMRAPNLSSDSLHGGDEPDEIYKRIALGIPGTPHPALVGTHEEIGSLVAYIRSIRSTKSAATTNHQRRTFDPNSLVPVGLNLSSPPSLFK
jgi:mono/diheme cytochrome c family protein/tetratricopeptide (TPR) repeat protein